METTPQDKPAIKRPAVPKHLKHFLFSGIKRRKEFKTIQKEHGKITSLSIIITPEKSILRCTCGKVKQDEPFTEKEMKQLLKMFKVDPAKVEASKHIFVICDFASLKISFLQEKKDGEIIKFDV